MLSLINQGRIMYSIFLLLLFIWSVRIDGFWIYEKSILCNYNYRTEYSEDKNDGNTVGFFNSSYIHLCLPEEVPIDNDIMFNIFHDESELGDYPDEVFVDFPPPKRECMYGLSLLVDPSIPEDECYDYKFDLRNDSRIHSDETNVCVFKHDNPFVKTIGKTELVNENMIGAWFSYIFKGCYALRFHINHKQKYIVSKPTFLNTTYQRQEVAEPQLVCKYNQLPNPEKSKMTNFTLEISISPDTGYFLQVALITQQDKKLKNHCVYHEEPVLFAWKIDLRVNRKRKEIRDKYCITKFVERIKGKYKKKVACNFLIEEEAAGSCFMYKLIEPRCNQHSVWMPSSGTKHIPCLWIKQCNEKELLFHIEPVKPNIMIQADMLLSANSYLLPIIAIVLIISAISGILCFRRYLNIRKEDVDLCPQHNDDSNYLKPTDFRIVDNSEKEIDNRNSSCDNIVLLYTNSSTSFMELMEDFRETLAKMCSCFVHDWHDGAVWNEVAKVGAVSWFTELLNNGCRVIWIDTPATRSIIISNSRDDKSNSDKLSKYYEIHDFRDMAFRGVLEVAKNKVTQNEIARQYRRHFVVRFEGLESTANVDDPFLDLSPHARYYMPKHLVQLCSDLSTVKSDIAKYKAKIDEDVYHNFVYQLYKSQTQQRLKSMKIDSTI